MQDSQAFGIQGLGALMLGILEDVQNGVDDINPALPLIIRNMP